MKRSERLVLWDPCPICHLTHLGQCKLSAPTSTAHNAHEPVAPSSTIGAAHSEAES